MIQSYLVNQSLNSRKITSDAEPTPTRRVMIKEVERTINNLNVKKAQGLNNITLEEIQISAQGLRLIIIHKFCGRI